MRNIAVMKNIIANFTQSVSQIESDAEVGKILKAIKPLQLKRDSVNLAYFGKI